MANIVIPFAAVSHAPVPSVGFNNNFTEVAQKFNTYAVQTDVAKVINAAHTWNAAQTWAAVQTFAGLTLTGDVLFTDGLYDIGKTGLTRPRDGFFSRNVVVGGTLNVTGVVTGASFAGSIAAASLTGAALPATVTGSSLTSLGTLGVDLLFTDALFDIGKSGATRPRDGFFSRNIVAGGTISGSGLSVSGSVSGSGFSVGGQQVVGARAAGWATQTGAQTRADMGGAPTLATVASTLDALIMDLRAHGLI
jgi:hypothetical protein